MNSNHPCFNPGASRKNARVHLPVAPACNVQCNFCNRKYDCLNESRPGVTSAVLSPDQALLHLREQRARRDDISVVGIAGPGDPLADAARTLETLRLVREAFPDLLLCVATNGLALPRHVEALVGLGVSHLTVTVNAVDVAIGRRIYEWMRKDGERLQGRQAAAHLLRAQEEAIRRLAETDVTVKVNTIVIPGINDDHVEEVAGHVREWGADLMNCMALKPTAGTPFADIPESDPATLRRIRQIAGRHLPQMAHCTRCRSDACGRLGEDDAGARQSLLAVAGVADRGDPERELAAVASRDGYFVNLHLGEAAELLIYRASEEAFDLVDVRPTPGKGGGVERWREMAERLSDCRVVVVSGVGQAPRAELLRSGLEVVEAGGLISEVLDPIFAGQELPHHLRSCATGCGAACSGSGAGCG